MKELTKDEVDAIAAGQQSHVLKFITTFLAIYGICAVYNNYLKPHDSLHPAEIELAKYQALYGKLPTN